jgi:hypothetical protein
MATSMPSGWPRAASTNPLSEREPSWLVLHAREGLLGAQQGRLSRSTVRERSSAAERVKPEAQREAKRPAGTRE